MEPREPRSTERSYMERREPRSTERSYTLLDVLAF